MASPHSFSYWLSYQVEEQVFPWILSMWDMGQGRGRRTWGGMSSPWAMTKSAPEGCCWGVGEGWPRTTFLRPLGIFVQLWLAWARILPAAGFALGFSLSPATSKSQGKRQYIFLSHCEHWVALLFALRLILLLLIHFTFGMKRWWRSHKEHILIWFVVLSEDLHITAGLQ